jgi:hypothetical protein
MVANEDQTLPINSSWIKSNTKEDGNPWTNNSKTICYLMLAFDEITEKNEDGQTEKQP